MNTDLFELFKNHAGFCSHKWTANLERYAALFESRRDEPVRILEIGVQNGGSLEIWGKFFTNAVKIIGCDIDPKCSDIQFDDPRIQVVVGDAANAKTHLELLKITNYFDIIFDDGSHRSGDIISTFCGLFPALAEEGVYIAEDLHCSYWKEYDGGLFAPHSSIAFFKTLCDLVNNEHWGNKRPANYIFNGLNGENMDGLSQEQLTSVHSIEFTNSLCIIKKCAPIKNQLGLSLVSGSVSQVNSDVHAASSRASQAPVQDSNKWADVSYSPTQVLAELKIEAGIAPIQPSGSKEIVEILSKAWEKDVRDFSDENVRLSNNLSALSQKLSDMESSYSWRFTCWCRWIADRLRKVLG